MAHYDCESCGAYLCMGECVEKRKEFILALANANMSEKDFYLLENTRNILQANYQGSSYSIGLALKYQLDQINARLKEVK